MSRATERALAQLASPAAILAREPRGARFGVYPKGDRRRRPGVRLSASEVSQLESEGAIARIDAETLVLTPAGRAHARRLDAPAAEAFAGQHRPVIARTIVDADGDLVAARGHDADASLRRLSILRDGGGNPWLSSEELRAASRLRQDWLFGQIGLVRGADWRAAPRSGSARGPTSAAEQLTGAQCDARRRVETALSALAPQLRRAVEMVCLREDGLETLERAEGWPARSGKIALKLALAQLATRCG